MPFKIDQSRFNIAHKMFSDFLLKKSRGIPFTNFNHTFIINSEISYKWTVYHNARKALNLNKWRQWKKSPGRIIEALKKACDTSVSDNLLEHRYGRLNSSEAPLYKVKGSVQIKKLENQFINFFPEEPSSPSEFGIRFDALANYLRENRLGCKWAFLAYLAFLLRPQTYFPVLPTPFDSLLHFYGIKKSIAGHVSWKGYSILLELAELLKDKLSIYGELNAIEIQSYMWVVSYLIKDATMYEPIDTPAPDFNSQLAVRAKIASERERIGLLGEWFVYDQEKEKLIEASRKDLARRVRLVSLDTENCGYDILSFNPDESEIHIEVKTTTRSKEEDDLFWLTDIEKQKAESDIYWSIYRVWYIKSTPTYENLGNIILEKNKDWELNTSSWIVRRKKVNLV